MPLLFLMSIDTKKDKGKGIVPRVPSKCIKVRSSSISN